ncbi:hypothetical protein [Streptomyces roseochromogenus]|uniref:Uncharacterized protein n=1 Tax=Streptomyces roseochromogenus subsp. oscitans DS 12.976 TaxID=1352936 RepID=V6KHK1_STRRC|nr:hypothetical protein [Streptomyces roseochromogenus]EST31552.1 hypothetical protein M878_16465 [Streptomyces roseochromogenus subsp. oscitans DS 12.976]
METTVVQLRDALKANGITLPSLGVDLVTFASAYAKPLIHLGNCDQATAQALTEALNEAAGR